MKKFFTLLFVSLFFALLPQAQAQEPGDVGSPECLAVQITAQDAVADGFPYRNHGQMVRTAAYVKTQAEEAGEITEECASCIMNQFARRIPIDEQESCGLGLLCPTALNADERDRWYESDSFFGINEITMVVTFTSPHELSFAEEPEETFQLWIIPEEPCDDDDPECPAIPPVTVNEAPSGIVEPGLIITYNLTIDVSDFSSSIERFTLRPKDNMLFGTLSPSRIPLEEVYFTCN